MSFLSGLGDIERDDHRTLNQSLLDGNTIALDNDTVQAIKQRVNTRQRRPDPKGRNDQYFSNQTQKGVEEEDEDAYAVENVTRGLQDTICNIYIFIAFAL